MSSITHDRVLELRRDHPIPDGQWCYDSGNEHSCDICDGCIVINEPYFSRDDGNKRCKGCSIKYASKSETPPAPPEPPEVYVPPVAKELSKPSQESWVVQGGRCYFCGPGDCEHTKRARGE